MKSFKKSQNHYVIDREDWAPKEIHQTDGGQLFDQTVNRSCCLGLILRIEDVDTKRIQGSGMPAGIDGTVPDSCKWLIKTEPRKHNSLLSKRAAEINDREMPDLSSREELLIELFAKHEITLEFQGVLNP